jgi:GTP cyclohydrolase III
LALLNTKRHDDFTRLTQDFTTEQSYAVLSARLTSPASRNVGLTVARALLFHKRFDDFARLTKGFTVEQSYAVLSACPTNPAYPNVGATVALALLLYDRYDNFTRLTQGFTAEQSYAILSAGPTNPAHPDVGATVALLLVFHERYDDFTRLTEGFTAEQSYAVLSACLTNPVHRDRGATIAHGLLLHKRYDDFCRLTQALSSQQTISLVGSRYKNKSLFTHLLDNEKPVVAEQLLDQCDYEHLVEFYNSLGNEAPETPRILYRCFYLLCSSLTEIFEKKSSAEGDEGIIEHLLVDLFQFFNTLMQTDYKKTCIEQLAALMPLANEGLHRKCAESLLLLKLKEPTFCELSRYSSTNNSLRVFAFYFSCLSMNVNDSDRARGLAKQYADDIKRAGIAISPKTNAGLFTVPKEASEICDEPPQKRIRDLEDEVKALKEESELRLAEIKRLKLEVADCHAEEPEEKRLKF